MSTQEKETEKVNGVEETVNETAAPKKRRRGINNEVRSVSRRKFQHSDAVNNLFRGALSVRKEWVTYGDKEGANSQFTGCKVPKLVFEFTSLHPMESEKRYAYINILPVESRVDTIPGGEHEWMFTQPIAIIKHVLEVFYLKNRQFTEEELDMLELDYQDYDDDLNFVPVEPQDILNAWSVMFDNVVKLLETGNKGQSCLLDSNGKPLQVWGKLVRYYKKNGEWVPSGNRSQEGDLVFPSFVGEGMFEIIQFNTDKQPMKPRNLMLDITKEAIIPMNVASKKKPNIAAGIGAGIPVGAGIIPPAAPMMGAAPQDFGGAGFTTDGGDDMPF